jgi:hypothetical protein
MSLVGAGFGITLLTEASAGAIIAGLVYRKVRDGAEPARIGYSDTSLSSLHEGLVRGSTEFRLTSCS